LIGEIIGVRRFATEAKLARAGGIASASGKDQPSPPRRWRQPPAHTAIRSRRRHPRALPSRTKAYIQLRRAEGETNRDAIRCLERRLARRCWHMLQLAPTETEHALAPSAS
jgi:hypothetical protein